MTHQGKHVDDEVISKLIQMEFPACGQIDRSMHGFNFFLLKLEGLWVATKLLLKTFVFNLLTAMSSDSQMGPFNE